MYDTIQKAEEEAVSMKRHCEMELNVRIKSFMINNPL